MEQNSKKKIEKIIKTLSYREIKKETPLEVVKNFNVRTKKRGIRKFWVNIKNIGTSNGEKVFSDQKKPEAKVKTGAKLLQRIQELSSCNPLRGRKRNRKVIFTPLQKIRRMRNHRYFVTGLKKAFALITIIAVIITAYFQNNQPVSAAAEAL